MKAEDLMIGDWVMWKNRQVQIASVSGIVYSFGQIDVVLAHCNDDNLLEKHDIKSVSPIPLTPELLERNGFVPAKKFRTHHFVQDDIYIAVSQWGRISVSSRGEKRGNRMNIDCHYLHELQHALKLCGINLEIKL